MTLIIKTENRQLYEVHITAYDFEKHCKASTEDLKHILSLIGTNDVDIDNSDDNGGGIGE